MDKVGQAKQISVKVENKIGAGAELIRLLADAEVNVIAFIGWTADPAYGILQFITGDYAKAKKAMKKARFETTATDVVWAEIPNRPGALADAAEKLAAAHVNIEYAYATTGGRKDALAVFRVDKPAKALKALA